MVRNMMALPPVRFTADVLCGFAVFSGITVVTLGPSTAAGLVTQVTEASALSSGIFLASQVAVNSVGGINNPGTILVVLAVVFSALFALNVAFIRHLRKAYLTVRVSQRLMPPVRVGSLDGR